MNIQHGLNLDQSFSKTRNADLQELIRIFEGINKILIASCIDRIVHEWLCKNYRLPSAKGKVLTLRQTQILWDIARQMVRCIIVRYYFQYSYRDCAIQLADGHLVQTFCLLKRRADKNNPGKSIVIAPSKSQLQRWETMLPATIINAITDCITCMATNQTDPAEPLAFDLNEPMRLENIYLDTTCLEANIHYPVDWKLLLDAVITLMKGTIRIRKAGLINRMQPPQVFIQ